jgi:hypothetical protein
LVLTEVRSELSIAKPDGELARPALPGDVIVLHTRPAQLPEAPAKAKDQSPPIPSTERDDAESQNLDPDALAVAQLFESLRGTDLVTRIKYYRTYSATHPRSRFAQTLVEEAFALERLLSLSEREEKVVLDRFAAPESAVAGVPLTLALEVRGPASGAVIHARRPGEVAYVTTIMKSVGRGYFSVTFPGPRVRAPELEYFIEATTPKGEAVSVVATSGAPEALSVEEPPKAVPPPAYRATVSVLTDYADWNRLRHNDVVWQTEGFFGMRFQDVGLRAGRTGFGVYRGIGGSLDELDLLDKSGRRVGLSYGYLEAEYGFSARMSLIGRAIVGLDDSGVDGGAQLHVRIGSDLGTNMTIGGEALGGVGVRFITQLELASWERVPVLFRSEVTNQPAGAVPSDDDVRPARVGTPLDKTSTLRGELGARAIAQVGYRLWPSFVVAARVSYQGRTINHAGPGFGGAVTYTW